jgi:hypothetical protein
MADNNNNVGNDEDDAPAGNTDPLDAIVGALEGMTIGSYDDFREACGTLVGVRPTQALFRRLLKRAKAWRCDCCPHAQETKQELIRHMRKKKHFYGQARLKSETSEFLERVKRRNPALIVDITSERAFTDLVEKFEDLTVAEQMTYGNIFEIRVSLIHCRG